MPEQITPSYDWPNLTKCRVELEHPDTRAWAVFIIDNLTKANKETLSGILPFMVKHYGWLHDDIAGLFGSVIEDRTSALVKAVDSGKVESTKYPTLSYQREREIVGAAICELISQGYESEFFKEISDKTKP